MAMDQVFGILRAILAAGGGYLVSRGVVDEATVTAVVGAAITIATAVWSVVSKRSA